MPATEEMLKWMRKVLNEVIREEMTEEDTNFTDLELSEMLDEFNGNKYKAVAQGWMIKAGLTEQGDLTQYSVGGESYTFTDKAKYYEHCMKMHQHYEKLGKRSGVRLFEADVGNPLTDEPEDFSRLMGGKFDAESH